MTLLDVIQNRRSCRAYDAERPVDRQMVEKLLEAARLAPSACNQQPWRFAVVTDGDTRGRIADKALLPGSPTSWIGGAPVLIVLGIQRSLVTHRVAPAISGVDYPWMDIGIAGEHLVLQATELGLGSCWVGWIRPGPLRRIVAWPKTIRPAAIITLGWPAEGAARKETPRKGMRELVTWV